MTTPEYIKARKKLKCQYIQQKRDAQYHQDLGKLLQQTDERKKMEVDKEDLVIPSAQDLDFMY